MRKVGEISRGGGFYRYLIYAIFKPTARSSTTMNMALSLQHFPPQSALRDRGSVIRTLSEIGSDS